MTTPATYTDPGLARYVIYGAYATLIGVLLFSRLPGLHPIYFYVTAPVCILFGILGATQAPLFGVRFHCFLIAWCGLIAFIYWTREILALQIINGLAAAALATLNFGCALQNPRAYHNARYLFTGVTAFLTAVFAVIAGTVAWEEGGFLGILCLAISVLSSIPWWSPRWFPPTWAWRAFDLEQARNE